MKELDLKLEDIKEHTKAKMKLVLKNSIREAAFKFLSNKKSKLSKGSEINYKKLECQQYLEASSKLPKKLMQEIFMIRSRNLQVRCNFPKQNIKLECCAPSCQSLESQKHLYECKFFEPTSMMMKNNDVKYEDIFHK